MGNCVHGLSYRPIIEKVTVVTYNGEILEFKGQTKVKKIITSSEAYKGYNLVHHSQPFSPLPPKTNLEPGEVYYLVPGLARLLIFPMRQKIKIVLTREELELLLRSSSLKQAQSTGVSRFEEEEGSPKWRPSLASIAEAKDF